MHTTILFLPVAAISHFNSTFKIARALKQRGNRVVYGTSGKYKELVAVEGFEFIDLNITPVLSLDHDAQLFRKNMFRLFLSYLPSLGNSRLKRTRLMVSEYQKQIAAVNPSYIFIDSYHALNAVFLSHLPAKIISFNILLRSDKVEGIPPINSDYIPIANRLINNIITDYIWRKYFIARFFREFLEKVIFCGKSNLALFDKLSSIKNVAFKDRIRKDKFHYGLKDIEEISFAPQKLEFKNANIDQKLFATSMVEATRRDDGGNMFQLVISKCLTLRSTRGWSLVYCCLGTLSNFHSRHAITFLEKLIKTFKESNRILIISTGESQSLNHLLSLSQKHENIFIIEKVPQLKMLAYADLMITHGGINSIMECISQRVPMLVYPLSASYDQRGNAARVVHHGLGLRGEIAKDSCKTISRRIDSILSAKSRFEKNLKEFDSGLSYEVDLEKIISD